MYKSCWSFWEGSPRQVTAVMAPGWQGVVDVRGYTAINDMDRGSNVKTMKDANGARLECQSTCRLHSLSTILTET